MSNTKDLKIPLPPSASLLLPATVNKTQRVSLEGVANSRVERFNYRGNGHWLFDKQMGEGKVTGFIYLIRNLRNGMMYIGKKQYKSAGKLTKGKESNWPWYITSCDKLAEDIKLYKKESFEFICIEEYVAKGAVSWAETWSLCHVEAPSNKDIWYNTLINKVSWNVKEPVTEKHKYRLELFTKGNI